MAHLTPLSPTQRYGTSQSPDPRGGPFCPAGPSYLTSPYMVTRPGRSGRRLSAAPTEASQVQLCQTAADAGALQPYVSN